MGAPIGAVLVGEAEARVDAAYQNASDALGEAIVAAASAQAAASQASFDARAASSSLLALTHTAARLQWWLRNFNGIIDPPALISSPPTITVGTSTSFNGRSSGNESYRWDNALLTHIGSNVISDGASPTRAVGNHITAADNSLSAGVAPIRTRFAVFGDKFGAMFRGTGGAYVNAIIDGQYAVKDAVNNPIFPADGNPHEVLFSFGSNSVNKRLVQSAPVGGGGSGYVVGDILTVSGGTFTTPATVQVTAVSSGAVTGVAVKNPGSYSVIPTGTLATTGGTGSGCSVLGQVWGGANTVTAPRRVELIWHGSGQKLYGINTPLQGVLSAYPVPVQQPKLVILGDSQQGTYLDYGGAHMGLEIAHRLGMADKYVGSHIGGTGWNVNNTTTTPNGLKWSDSRRIADVIAQNPDALVIIGSQNDSWTDSYLTAAVTATLNAFLASNPSLRIVGIGPVAIAMQATSTAIAAGFAAASDQTRVRYIDNVALGWVTGSGNIIAPTGTGTRDWTLSSDNAHLINAGQRMFASLAAHAIADALVSMIQ